jgi:tetratricopeptide (TPR) repeat protein
MPQTGNRIGKGFKGVMVSSTFTDMKEHRLALMAALRKEELFPIGMEDHQADPDDDEISVSLKMVEKASAYVGLISHRYGTIYPCAERNPFNHSICRLEFEAAERLKLPTVIFEMSDDHKVKVNEIERDPEKIKQLDAYRTLARKGRIYQSFDDLNDFTLKATRAAANLRRFLEDHEPAEATPAPARAATKQAKQERAASTIPIPPAFYSEPPYIGSHRFVGRRDQLDTLNEWALPADSHAVLLYEAIGGSGKSMLTWEWVRNHAPKVPQEWAGRFWYSFYERDGRIADFCQHALAYMTGQPLDELKKQKTTQLIAPLLSELQSKPWLLVLDGLERVLVAYHRIDAAQLRDEEAGRTDIMAQRDPCAAIRPEDDDLLRLLATAAPSKLLITSRLVPRVLLNVANQPIPGVRREVLPGLRPQDAEDMFVASGVRGDSAAIQAFLKSHCDCHPLTVGALAGLVVHYMRDRGNFDTWSRAAEGAGALNLAELDLVQKRNHILTASIRALQDDSRRLLAILALLSKAIDYNTIEALKPFVETRLKGRRGLTADMTSTTTAPTARLSAAIKDLERRGLLQYDAQARQYDLHPVVRAVAADSLERNERMTLGQRVVDHFSGRPRPPFDHESTHEDLDGAINLMRAFAQIDKLADAANVYVEFSSVLLNNLEAYAEIVTLLRPFFADGWGKVTPKIAPLLGGYLTNSIAIALGRLGEVDAETAALEVALNISLEHKSLGNVSTGLGSVAMCYLDNRRLATAYRLEGLSVDLAALIDDPMRLFHERVQLFALLAELGRWPEAEGCWEQLDSMGRNWDSRFNAPGTAERHFAFARFYQNRLTEADLIRAELLVRTAHSRVNMRHLHRLRGEWLLTQRRWGAAAASLHEAVAMAQAVGVRVTASETLFTLARYHLGQLVEPRRTAAALAAARSPFDLGLARLWLAIGDRSEATRHALKAYKWAWADGEPFVYRYYLNESEALLKELGAEIPSLSPYDPASDPPLPWEKDVIGMIERLRQEKQQGKGKVGGNE